MRFARFLGLLLPLVGLACGAGDASDGGISGPPEDDGPPGPPTQPPPTGSKWQGVEVTGACGRTWLEYVLVDEVCGGTDDPAYMDYFHAPIMRDGALLGGHLFAVDATYLWVLDVSSPSEPERVALLAGFGQPLAVGAHAGRLVVAAGDEGLLLVDVTDPASPVRTATIDLGGPALDVFVDGDRAFVATGPGGVAVVDLATESVEKVLAVAGFAAAVAAQGDVAYVAACDTFAAVRVSTGALLGETWVQDHTQSAILVAPAKDVALVGDVAFVAAGRYGAVAVDVSDPAAPALLGNCTEEDDLAFYASGVRTEGGTLFVAGGEWGIKPLSVANPALACQTNVVPSLPPLPEEGEEVECSTAPPWEVLPWQDSWAPPPEPPPSAPPPGRDPIQTLPVPGLVYAFGDATRIGIRAIDVRETATPDLVKIGRYSEPRLTEGIAVQGDKLLVAGKAGGLFRIEAGGIVLDQDLVLAKTARAAGFLGDGRWVLGAPEPTTGGGTIHIEGLQSPVATPDVIWPGPLAARVDTVFVPIAEGVLAIAENGQTTVYASGKTAALPQAIAAGDDRLLLAAPEWEAGVSLVGANAEPLGPNGVFDSGDFYDVSLWARGLPRRVLFDTAFGAVEVASFGGEAGITLHDVGPVSAALPGGDYIGGAVEGSRAWLVSVDRGRYRTTLVGVRLDAQPPEVESVVGFTGMASGVAAQAGRLYVADGDRGIRVYDASAGAPILVDLVSLPLAP